MLPNEYVKEMYIQLVKSLNNLKPLILTNSNEEMVRKILRCLPRFKWGPKAMAIEEAQIVKIL